MSSKYTVNESQAYKTDYKTDVSEYTLKEDRSEEADSFHAKNKYKK